MFGIFNTTGEVSDVASRTYYALYALQHRGQESCGICVGNDGVMKVYKDIGLVPEVLTREKLDALGPGNMAIGYVMYSKTGKIQIENTQPILIHHVKGSMAIAHNGSLTNANELREQLELKGAIFHTTSDTEVIAYTITQARLTEPSIEKAVSTAMKAIGGAYSLIIMSPRKLIAVRDPYGFRPLCMGRLGDSIIFASESCGLDALGAELIRDVEPGEIIVAAPEGITSIRDHCGSKPRLCAMEFVYIARPDSITEGESVHLARKRAGAYLARSNPVEADIVIGMPDSGLDAALGYAEESGIPYGIGITRNRYVGRTFIQPTQSQRIESVSIKLAPLRAAIEGKRVIVVDDSIVRGTSTRYIISQLKLAGAKEVHVRISSPLFKYPCYFGVEADDHNDLIAYQQPDIGAIAREIGADSLGYITIEDFKKTVDERCSDFCVGCFSGVYPAEIPKNKDKLKFERKLSEINS